MSVIQFSEAEWQTMQKKMLTKLGFPSSNTTLTEMHTVEGAKFSGRVPRDSLMAIRDLEMREDDIIIAAFHKSGTHWIWEITLLLLAQGQPENIDRMKMHGFPLEFLTAPEMKIPSHEIFAEMDSPRITVTHLPWQFLPEQITVCKKGRIIYLMRNPKDVLASTCRFVTPSSDRLKDSTLWEYILHSFLSGSPAMGYCSWFDHVQAYWRNREHENVFFTSYEDLKLDFLSVARLLSQFLFGKELDDSSLKRVQEHASLKGMKKNYDDIEKLRQDGESITKVMGTQSFIQKGVIGSWKDFFTVAENELFDRVAEEKMSDWDFRPIYQT